MNKLSPRTWTILLAVVVLTALLLLSASLNSLELAEGKPLPTNRMAPPLVEPGDTDDLMGNFLAVIRVLMIVFWALVPFYVIYLIISKQARKRFIRDMLSILPFLLLLYFLTNNDRAQDQVDELSGRFGLDSSESDLIGEAAPPLPEFQPPPDWVTTVISLTLAVIFTVIVIGIVYAIWRRTRERKKEPLLRIEQEAQDAIDAIEAGGDLREVIQRCYFQMIEALREYRNIQRNRDVTPHEFELMLQRRGLPSVPIHQLTSLFEEVRYGGHQPGRQEERLAISSLSAIVTACQNVRDAEGRL